MKIKALKTVAYVFIIPSHHSAEVVETGEPRWRWAEVETRRLGGGGKGGGEKGEKGVLGARVQMITIIYFTKNAKLVVLVITIQVHALM